MKHHTNVCAELFVRKEPGTEQSTFELALEAAERMGRIRVVTDAQGNKTYFPVRN